MGILYARCYNTHFCFQVVQTDNILLSDDSVNKDNAEPKVDLILTKAFNSLQSTTHAAALKDATNLFSVDDKSVNTVCLEHKTCYQQGC